MQGRCLLHRRGHQGNREEARDGQRQGAAQSGCFSPHLLVYAVFDSSGRTLFFWRERLGSPADQKRHASMLAAPRKSWPDPINCRIKFTLGAFFGSQSDFLKSNRQ